MAIGVVAVLVVLVIIGLLVMRNREWSRKMTVSKGPSSRAWSRHEKAKRSWSMNRTWQQGCGTSVSHRAVFEKSLAWDDHEEENQLFKVP